MKKNLSNKKILLIPISMQHLNDLHEYSTNPIFFKYFVVKWKRSNEDIASLWDLLVTEIFFII